MNKGFLVVLLSLAFATGGLAQTRTEAERAEAYFHFTKARVLDANGDWENSIVEYKRALEADPSNSLIMSDMADTYLRHRRVREAVDAAEKAIQADPDNLEAHKLLGSVYVNTISTATAQQPVTVEAVDKAIHEFEEIVRIDTGERQSYLMLGRLYQMKNQPAKAAQIYSQFLNIEPGSEEAVVSLARLQVEAGNDQEAIRLLEAFLKNEPEAPSAWETLGEAYSNTEQHPKAVAAYKRAVDLDPEDAEFKKSYASALFLDDQLDEASAAYKDVLDEDPDDGVALLRLAQIYRRQQKFGEARELLQRGIQLFPESLDLEFNLVLLDRDEGLLEDAVKRTTAILKKTEHANGRYSEVEKQNRRVFATNLALFNSSLGRYDEAIRAFTELKALTPERDGNIDAMIVDAYRSARNIDKAIEYSQQAMKEVPESRQLQLTYAELIAQKGNIDAAVQSLEKLPRSDDLDVLSTKFDIYRQAKRFDDAQAVLDSGFKRFPNDLQMYFLQGSLYEKQKKYNEAERSFRRALDIDKENPAVLNYLGYMLADRGTKLDEAVGLIQKAVDSDPTNGAYLDSLGWAYFRMNKLDLAQQYLEKAVRFVVTDPDLHEHLGDLYFKQNRFEDARMEWNKAIQLGTESEDIEGVRKKLDGLRNRVAKK
jgi:tetratricopeptide (TPR) repeat protein